MYHIHKQIKTAVLVTNRESVTPIQVVLFNYNSDPQYPHKEARTTKRNEGLIIHNEREVSIVRIFVVSENTRTDRHSARSKLMVCSRIC